MLPQGAQAMPAYRRRIVMPPAPVFSHPDVQLESDEDEEETGINPRR